MTDRLLLTEVRSIRLGSGTEVPCVGGRVKFVEKRQAFSAKIRIPDIDGAIEPLERADSIDSVKVVTEDCVVDFFDFRLRSVELKSFTHVPPRLGGGSYFLYLIQGTAERVRISSS